MAVYFYSDPHFFHKNIIAYENRPFATVEEMNAAIIRNHNAIVKSTDKVFILGDFGFANKEAISAIVSQLNGYKILVMGNHDRGHSRKWWLETGFDEVHENPILYKDFFILSHEPVYLNEHMPYANVHGHIHSRTMSGNYVNVSVEVINYKPVLFEDIVALFRDFLEE